MIPVSFLDLLSCGLAVVVILLIVSLNTGQGSIDETIQTTSVDITTFGYTKDVPEYIIKWKEETIAGVPVPIDGVSTEEMEIARLKILKDTLTKAMSAVSGIIYSSPKELVFNGVRKLGNEWKFVFSPLARGTTLTMEIAPQDPNDPFHLQCELRNQSDKVVKKVSEIAFDRRIKLEISYRGGTKVKVSYKDNDATLGDDPIFSCSLVN